MCTNCRWIYNPYKHAKVYVPCGKCPACLQKKATQRANRIRNNFSTSTLPLFVTLTYNPDSIPYVYRSDLARFKDTHGDFLSVYRNQRVYHAHNRSVDYCKFDKGRVNVGSIYIDEPTHAVIRQTDLYKLKSPRGSSSDVVGVAFYKDLQDFEKRLYINLKRNGFSTNYTYYQCSEYGPTTQRPHFHLLLFVPSAYASEYRDCICKSWPYADFDRTNDFIEVARNAASYVASYVNKPSDFPALFKTNAFKEKHSYSQGFGKLLDVFSLASILEKTSHGTLTYNVTTVRQGFSELSSIPIPAYVINRYFPKFKGFSRIAPDSLYDCLLRPSKLAFQFDNKCVGLDISQEEINGIRTMLYNAWQRCCNEIPMSYEDYCINYISVWRKRSSDVLRNWYEYNVKNSIPWTECYDNINELKNGKVCTNVEIPLDCEENPNYFPTRVLESSNLELTFYRKLKTSKVLNTAMSNLNLNV